MIIQVEINKPDKLAFVIELLNSFDFVDWVKPNIVVEPINAVPKTFLEKYNGCMPNLDVTSFEKYVTKSRNEWERNIY